MNERIKELASKALDQAVPETWTTLTPEQLEKVQAKFAELIVGECCQALWADACNMSDLAVEEFNSNSKKIKRHFGV